MYSCSGSEKEGESWGVGFLNGVVGKAYNNKAAEMDMEDRNPDSVGPSNIKEKIVTLPNIGDSNIVYNVELAVSQANAISQLLPKKYSLVVDRSIKPRRNNKKSTPTDLKNTEFKEVDSFHQEVPSSRR